MMMRHHRVLVETNGIHTAIHTRHHKGFRRVENEKHR